MLTMTDVSLVTAIAWNVRPNVSENAM